MAFFVFLIIQTFYSIALHGTRPIVSLFANSQGASPFFIGVLVSVFAFLPMLLALSVGKWLDIYGAKRMVLLGGSGMFLALMVPIIYPHLFTLFISQFLIGFSHLSVLVALQKTVGNLPGNRDKLIAYFSLTGSSGELLGPLISGFSYEHFGFQLTYSISSVFVILAVGIGVILSKQSWKSGDSTTKRSVDLKTSWNMLRQVNLRNALIISGLVLFSKDLFVAYFPVYGSQVGLNAGTIGIILSVMAGMAIIVRIAQFWLVQTFGRGKILMITLFISGIIYFLVPLNTNVFALAGLALLLGGGLGLGQPLSLVYALNVSPVDRQGEVLGMRLTFNRGSQFIAPILFGGIGGIAGLFPIFWMTGMLLLAGSYYTRVRPDKEKKGSQEKHNF